jgi:hypothetical protein
MDAAGVLATVWVTGTAETLVVIAFMAGGYRISARISRRRTAASLSTAATPIALVDA